VNIRYIVVLLLASWFAALSGCCPSCLFGSRSTTNDESLVRLAPATGQPRV
jgi:hypothetical protein